VWLVELATVSRVQDVAAACASALGLRRTAPFTIPDVATALGDQQRVIVLDNCEHVLDAVAALGASVERGCANVRLIATSRERLDVVGEVVVQLAPLSVAEVDNSPAVELFVSRATAAVGTFEPTPLELDVIHALCTRLDGLPLAIELAAARLGGLGVDEMLARLDDRFRLLSRRHDSDPRHASLLATIQWSYDLLSDRDRTAFEQLSVFAGDFDLPSAEWVAAGADSAAVGDCLASLVEQSMLVALASPVGRRFRMLETVREFAALRLDDGGGTAAARRRHLERYIEVAREADAELRGIDEHRAHLAMSADWHNIRAAMTSACDMGDAAAATELLAEVMWFTITRLRTEVGEWVDRIATLPGVEHLPQRALVTAVSAWFANLRADFGLAPRLLSEAIEQEQITGPLAEPWVSVVAPFIVPDPLPFTDETQRRARVSGDAFWMTVAMLQEAMLWRWVIKLASPSPAELETHLTRIRDAMQQAEELGNPNGIAYASMVLGSALSTIDPDEAERLLLSSLGPAVHLGLALMLGQARSGLYDLYVAQGRALDALRVIADATREHLRVGFLSDLAYDVLECSMQLLHLDRHPELAARAIAIARHMQDEIMKGIYAYDEYEALLISRIGADAYAREAAHARGVGIVGVAREVLAAVDGLDLLANSSSAW